MSTLEVYNNRQSEPKESLVEEFPVKEDLNLPNKKPTTLEVTAKDMMGLSWLFIEDKDLL